MKTTSQIAKHLREAYFGGNWTVSNMKDVLNDVSWQEATAKIYDLNTIATLVFHISYFVGAISMVLRGEPLNASDKLSFAHPPIQSETDWQHFLEQVWRDAEEFAALIEQLPDERLSDVFSDAKYGSYHRNLLGCIEHLHYHLGQIAIIKKLVRLQL